MSVIQIREQGVVENGFEVSLHIDGQDYGRVVVKAPFADQPQKDADLTWYFETWLRMPFADQVRAARSASSVREYGVSLFDQVFAGRDAYSAYGAIRNDLEHLEIEIIGAGADFQAWHWEALCDPGLPRPLAVDCRLVRKHTQRTAIAAVVKEWPVVNVLLVTARPDEEDDVGYRTISRSMVEMVKNAHLRVNIEILRPATYQALIERLEKRGAGYYHILHFDGHGALMTYDQYLTGLKGDRLSFQRGYGLRDLAKYEGSKAFLFFDGDAKGRSVPVEAQELAGLLQGKQIPVCILNACQSAMQLADGRETSLGSQLMAAGMQAVVAMGYSVTVTAAQVLMKKLYGELFGGKDFATAVRLGRYELYNDKRRRGAFNTWIDLEDWLLPVVYGSSVVNLRLREFAPAEEEAYYEGLGSRYRFMLPSYGFVGRDLEILKIEKGLLRHNVLLLRGMGGTGKTTLLCYLREWWQTTNFADDVFYFGYDERAWTLAQILFAIGQRVYDKFENARFVAMSVAAQVPKLAEKLRSSNYIVVLDNLESVTGQQLAIQNTLNAAEQGELRDFLALLVGGKTRVVLGSRSGEEWLRGVFGQNVYVLRGLDLEARSDLAELILQRHVAAARVKEIKEDADFGRLMGLLAGYPLAMEVVLANLRRQSPGEVLDALRLADVGLDGEGQDKTTSILKCVEYSHSNLSESAQQLLLCLAPFSGFIWRDGIPLYAEELKKLEPFKNYDFAGFDDAIQEAINWGLLSPIASNSGEAIDTSNESLLSIQPILPYFLKVLLNESTVEIQSALQEGFKKHYFSIARSHYQLMQSQDPQEKQLGVFICHIEYENLYAVLQTCLKNHESFSDIYCCLYIYFSVISDKQGMLNIAKKVHEALEKYPAVLIQGELSQEAMITLDYLAHAYLRTQQFDQAKKIYQTELDVLASLQSIDVRQQDLSIAGAYHNLGVVAQELREWADARHNYHQALTIFVEFGNRYEQGKIYHQLGMIAQELREWDDAHQNYHQALAIFMEFGDRYQQGKIYHQLGIVAQTLSKWDDARQNYHQAFIIYMEFGDRYEQGKIYHQLGILAQELREWDDARQNYHQALTIFIEFDDRYEQGKTYHQLGRVAQELKEWDDARYNYHQDLLISVEFGDCYEPSKTYYQLGLVAQELGEWDDARHNYHKALAIGVEFDDRYSQAVTYGQIGLLAEDEGDLEVATKNLLQALQIFAGFKDEHNSIGITIRNLGRLYQSSQSPEVITTIANILGVSESEVQQAFDAMNQGT
jgi:tetratricopeptide (TPR) repeat protein